MFNRHPFLLSTVAESVIFCEWCSHLVQTFVKADGVACIVDLMFDGAVR